jgi:hypothetical protein
LKLTPAARSEKRKDLLGLPSHDVGIESAVAEAIAWLGRAQDQSASHDGGVARDFSLLTGWNASYPETTGYVVPTLIEYAKLTNNQSVFERAKQMLDWLVSIQFPEGGFQGGVIGAKPKVPVTFNTGQILLGLASGALEFGEPYYQAMRRAADWLVKTQDSDGCWRKNPSPFAEPGEKAYETHVAWGLLEAARVDSNKQYASAALANVNWALGLQCDNGWFKNCCLSDYSQPLTHTLGYVLRGILEAYRFTEDVTFLTAARKTADGLLKALGSEGDLPGRLNSNWEGTVPWTCLTGTAQVAYSWLALYQYTDELKYRDAAFAANQYVRRTVNVVGRPDVRGGVKGSFPISGAYCAYEYPNSACKFFIDSNLFELAIRKARASRIPRRSTSLKRPDSARGPNAYGVILMGTLAHIALLI